MKNGSHFLPSTRREFLRMSTRGVGLLAFSSFAPSFLVKSTLAAAPAPEKDRTILVLVQLAGGNDGLNTLIPFEDANYYRLRPTLGIQKDQALAITDQMALHPACGELRALFQSGELAVVQNVGYPNPNRSHFRSGDIWQTASDSDRVVSTGWVGRYLDNCCSGAPANHDPDAIHVGPEMPTAFAAQQGHVTFGLNPSQHMGADRNLPLLENLVEETKDDGHSNEGFLRQTMMDALVTEKRVQTILDGYRTAVAYPNHDFARSLRSVAALVAANLPTRVYFVSLTGFDTHANQANRHRELLATLSSGLSAFQRDLKVHRLDQQVLTMTFSEFGRRPMENESHGTDHGTAAPLFVMGSRIHGGIHGTAPKLDLARNQDLTFTTDFRQVYATVLDRWLGSASKEVLGADFAPAGFL